MGPIQDECGVEQGGINFSDFYKIYNNEQLNLAQESGFGVPFELPDWGRLMMLLLSQTTSIVSKAFLIIHYTTEGSIM